MAVSRLPSSSYRRLLVQRLRDALGEAAVHLALDDQRVDTLPMSSTQTYLRIVDLAGLGVDLHGAQVGAVREGEVLRVEGGAPRRAMGSMPSGRLCAANAAKATSWIVTPFSVALDRERAVARTRGRRAEPRAGARRRPGLVDHLVGRRLDQRHAADGQRARAVGVHALGRDLGVAVQHLDVLERDAEPVGDDLAPRRLVALAVRRRPGDHLDLAGRAASGSAQCSQPPAP